MFSFDQRPGVTKILFDGREILGFVQEHLCFRDFRIDNLRLKPDGPVEIISLMPSCFYYNKYLRADIACEIKSANEVEIVLKPLKVDGNLHEMIFETRTINIKYDASKRRFIYTFNIQLEVKKDILVTEPGFDFLTFPGWEDDGLLPIEIDDPLLSGGKGPQVPMTQNWTGILEPCFHDECFTQNWLKRYKSVRINTKLRGIREIEFNRSINSVQNFYNRHILKALPRTPFIYEKFNRRFMEFTPLFDAPTGHHICEWGYDMHWYALLPKADAKKDFRFKKGTTLNFSYAIKEIDRNEVPQDYLAAKLAEMETEERILADMPIYEEPVCEFTKSGIDFPDASRWTPGNDKCLWNKSGGVEIDTGTLLINNGDETLDSKWTFSHLGPSYGCNPIPPKSKFKISAWIRADEPEHLKLTHTLNSYYGPGMHAIGKNHTVSLGTVKDVKSKKNGFQFIEFDSTESGPYCLDGSFEFSYSGKGTAEMSLLSIERL